MMEHGHEAAVEGNRRLIKGIAVLGAAAVISKLLGTLQKIPLQNIAGDEAYGIYSAVYPFYVLILFLATAGFPTAVSKLVSEQVAGGNLQEAHRIYRLSSLVLMLTGLAGFLFMYLGAGTIADWIGSRQAQPAVRSASYALLLVPIMAASRGYHQGLQNMIPTAVSQVVEQTVRVTVMIVLLLVLTEAHASSGAVAAGATFGSAAGAAAGLIVMLIYDLRERAVRNRQGAAREARSVVRTPRALLLRRIVSYAMPVALGSIAAPIISMIDSFTLPQLLVRQGLDESEALHQFGVYSRGLPLVHLVGMLFSSMAAALVPSLSDARAHGKHALVRYRAELSIRLTWLIGLAASAGLAAVSLPANIMLFTDASGTWTMVIVAWTAVFSSLGATTAAILQGISREKLPALHLLIAAAIKVLLNLLLIPPIGIAGAAWSGVIANAAACWLNVRAVRRHVGISWRWREALARPILSVAAMLGVIAALYGLFALLTALTGTAESDRLWNTGQALVMIAVGAAAFGLAALRSGALSEAELQLVPGVYRRLSPLLRRWRILPERQAGVGERGAGTDDPA